MFRPSIKVWIVDTTVMVKITQIWDKRYLQIVVLKYLLNIYDTCTFIFEMHMHHLNVTMNTPFNFQQVSLNLASMNFAWS